MTPIELSHSQTSDAFEIERQNVVAAARERRPPRPRCPSPSGRDRSHRGRADVPDTLEVATRDEVVGGLWWCRSRRRPGAFRPAAHPARSRQDRDRRRTESKQPRRCTVLRIGASRLLNFDCTRRAACGHGGRGPYVWLIASRNRARGMQWPHTEAPRNTRMRSRSGIVPFSSASFKAALARGSALSLGGSGILAE